MLTYIFHFVKLIYGHFQHDYLTSLGTSDVKTLMAADDTFLTKIFKPVQKVNDVQRAAMCMKTR